MAFPQIGLEAVFRVQDFERNAAKYNATIDQMEKKTTKMSQAIGKTTQAAGRDIFGLTDEFRKGANNIVNDAQKTTSSFDEIKKGMQAVGVIAGTVTAAVVATAAAINKALEAGELAASLEDARVSYQNLAASSGVNAQQLISDLRSVSRGTVDTATLIKTANSALLAGGSQIAGQLPQLYQIAEASARATGQNTDFVFQTLIRGIIKASPLLIDNAEIYVKVGAAVDQYAESLGKTTDTLTSQERQMAVLNAVLADGGRFIEQAGGSAERATDPFKQLKTQTQAFSTGLKTLASPAITKFSEDLKKFFEFLQKSAAVISAFREVQKKMLEDFSNTSDALDIFNTAYEKALTTVQTGIAPIENTASSIDEVGQAADEAAEKLEEFNKEMVKIDQQYADKLADMQKQQARQSEDFAIQRARQLEDADRNLARQREDMARDNAKARAKIEQSNAKRLVEVEQNIAKQRQDAARDAMKQREDMERSHREALFQINQKAEDTISEAARRNDAVAIAAALRQKQREIRDEQRNKQIANAELQRDLTEKQMRIDEDAAISMEKARQQNAEALAAQQEAEAEQEADLKLSLQRQDEDRRLSWQRQDEDRARAWARQMEDLDEWYAEEERKLKEHLGLLENIAVDGIEKAGSAISKKALEAMQTLAGSSYGLTRAEQAAQRGNFLGSETTPAAPSYTDEEQWLRRHQFMAEGGVDVVNRPTHYVAGEAGPELAAFVPLRRNNLTIGGGVDVNVNGAGTGGMDTTAMQAIVYQAMVQVAQRISVAR